MLSKSHYYLLSEWISLLKNFEKEWQQQNEQKYHLTASWHNLQEFLTTKFISLSFDDLESDDKYLWQSWQTETHRYLRLLHTDLLFFATAKQPHTKSQKASTISQLLRRALELSTNLLATVDKLTIDNG